MLFPRNTAQIIMAHQYSVNMPIFRVLKQVAKGISQNYKVYFERYFQLLLSQASLTNLSHMIISFKFASGVQFIFIDLISNSGKGQNILPEWVVLGLIQMVEDSWQNFRDFLFQKDLFYNYGTVVKRYLWVIFVACAHFMRSFFISFIYWILVLNHRMTLSMLKRVNMHSRTHITLPCYMYLMGWQMKVG